MIDINWTTILVAVLGFGATMWTTWVGLKERQTARAEDRQERRQERASKALALARGILLDANPENAAFARSEDGLEKADEIRRRWFAEARPALLELAVGPTSVEVARGVDALIMAGGQTVNHNIGLVAEALGKNAKRRYEARSYDPFDKTQEAHRRAMKCLEQVLAHLHGEPAPADPPTKE